MGPHLLWEREIGIKPILRSEEILDGADIINNLDLYKTLRGHNGCVNTIGWSKNESLLSSGSDDTLIKLWNIEGDCMSTYETSHTHNIFGVLFVPGMNDSYLGSCGGDHQVILTNLETKEEVQKWSGGGRMKRLASSTHVSHLFWSISEDRFIRAHDTRSNHSDMKFKIRSTGKSIDVSDLQPHWIAVGSESENVSIYDTRNTRRSLMQLGPLDKGIQDSLYVTHVVFSRKSNSLLANYGRGSAYLFDLNDSSQESVFCQHLDELHQLDLNDNGPIDASPSRLSAPIMNIVDEAQSLFSDLHYVDALSIITKALQRSDMTGRERAHLLLKRATIFTARKREGDSYAAAQDTLNASLLLPHDTQSFLRFITVLFTMEQVELCREMISLFKTRFPDSVDELGDMEESLMAISRSNRRPHNVRRNATLTRDYSSRYCGHINNQTDIKEAAFFGPNEEYVMAGSDSGHIFVYSRDDSSILTLLKGDTSIVNCISPHPRLPIVAASGLDEQFLLFSPFNASPMPLETDSHRMTYSQAEPILARQSTRNLVRELVRMGDFDEERCQVS
ncbi:hypothetical protein PENTCL1PPCAC_22836 [Pristionchus entomophagus]|uniref:WD40 domain-containing protein n=1 Tax=Pristionchus entomophagus TaxID=358040 RepID=A0AAV5U2D7_9BILA|nr:hypothetical protein PENTCL1PPCAC_22836 [Pristionchus entomophagus]